MAFYEMVNGIMNIYDHRMINWEFGTLFCSDLLVRIEPE